MKQRLSPNRYLDYGARGVGDRLYEDARTSPTYKQIKFYKQLYALCKERGVDASTHHESSRVGYSDAISILLARLKEDGADVRGNGKTATAVLIVGEDAGGREYVKERLIVREAENENA